MSKSKYVIRIDYGTQSGRAVVVDVKEGKELASFVSVYFEGVIDNYLPSTYI